MQEFDPRRSAPRFLPHVLMAAIGFSGAAYALDYSQRPDVLSPTGKALTAAEIAALQHQAFAQAEAQPGYDRPESIELKVRPGETFEGAVQRAGVPASEARQVADVLDGVFDTVNIKAGLAIDAAIARPREQRGAVRLVGLSLRTGPASAVTVSRTFDGALKLRELEEDIRDETKVAHGTMQGSLYESAARAGANSEITAQVVKLFAHKLDFSRDLKAGDTFSLVFDRTVTESGKTIETGDLLYAEISAKGGTTRFYRFDKPGGGSDFFDETGKNIKGFLLRTPVDGARMTSRYGMRRHPILGYNRMHQGIDFGAGSGTPIVAAGDGVVVEARRWGGYGNWVRLRHTGGWETGYAHMSRFAKGMKKGQHVSQGQVIGYVGTTGASTGPHLHYEIWRNGKRTNPVGAKVPQGTVLAGADLARFKAQKARVDALLHDAGAPAPTQLAQAGPQRAAR
ncbi:MAG: M23 family metallopeptidase [Caulobacteraceae bacterium]|nr:M23 family metallopeptidase [Caulobacteraceae bacterium]